jgi:hypothetical protein
MPGSRVRTVITSVGPTLDLAGAGLKDDS